MAAPMGEWVMADDMESAAESAGSRDAPSVAPSRRSSNAYVPPAKRRALKNAKADHGIAELQYKIQELAWEKEQLEAKQAKTLGPKLPKFDLPFFLRKSKMAFLQERFPRTTFRCVSDNAHDHPLAHTETMIATKKALRLAPAGSLVVDYYGSASAMDAFNAEQQRSNNPKVGLAYIDYKSPKAFIRHRKVGAAMVNGVMRHVVAHSGIGPDLGASSSGLTHNGVHYTGENITWFFKHSLYYLSDEEIQECLSVEGSHAVAVIHRHDKSSGTLFDGECSYAKIEGCVQQVNKLTGESYTHRDLSWLWDSRSKVRYNSLGAFTWTFHMVSEDTWIIELTAVPPELDERYVNRAKFLGVKTAAGEMNDHDAVASHFPHPMLAELPDASCTLVGGIPVIKFKDVALPDCPVTSPELYEFLCTSAAGRPRTPDLMQNLFAIARSHVLSSSEFPGKKGFSVKAEDIANHVVLAYLSGLDRETKLLRSSAAYATWSAEHHSLLDGVHLNASSSGEGRLKGALFAAQRINRARKSGDTFDAILSSVARVS
eukprot:gnl/Spiro4/528_TR291_c0_g1_i1.p1 gnl/Spiro4/528_TR291_c0_g1~~gnl/Spiro4/528_TR291_c0_g1_i1.p1  ORF type:complete len:576 (-),score=32.72 gnl/Spiro4/528_TR291_c0_g1_i1:70-1698(-)